MSRNWYSARVLGRKARGQDVGNQTEALSEASPDGVHPASGMKGKDAQNPDAEQDSSVNSVDEVQDDGVNATEGNQETGDSVGGEGHEAEEETGWHRRADSVAHGRTATSSALAAGCWFSTGRSKSLTIFLGQERSVKVRRRRPRVFAPTRQLKMVCDC